MAKLQHRDNHRAMGHNLGNMIMFVGSPDVLDFCSSRTSADHALARSCCTVPATCLQQGKVHQTTDIRQRLSGCCDDWIMFSGWLGCDSHLKPAATADAERRGRGCPPPPNTACRRYSASLHSLRP